MDGGDRIEITVLGGIGEIAAAEWDACAGDGGAPPVDPFTTHRFLAALEASGSVGPGTGWTPRHLVARIGGAAIAVMPLYAKGHSQGEYIFDHNWAHAWETAGGRYYPKLQAAVPFTPATGRRFLTRPGFEAEGRAALLQGALTLAAPRRRLRPARHLLHRGRARLGRGRRPARPHHPAVPLGEPRLSRLRRLPRRPRLAQAQGDPQGARAGAGASAARSSR